MANFAIYRQAENLSTLKVGASASPATYTQIGKTQSYSMAGGSTDEVKLSYPSAQNFNAVAIAGLNSFPTITVTKTLSAVDTTLGTISGSTYAATARARSTFNALLLFADTDADDITLTFSTPYPTGFRTVFAGELAFQPTTNFQRGAQFVDSTEFETSKTSGSHYLTKNVTLRAFSPPMNLLSDEEFMDVNFAKYKIKDQVCLVVLDTANTSPEWWMLGNIVSGGSALQGTGIQEQSLEIIEAIEWL